jgi:hypothetical protein
VGDRCWGADEGSATHLEAAAVQLSQQLRWALAMGPAAPALASGLAACASPHTLGAWRPSVHATGGPGGAGVMQQSVIWPPVLSWPMLFRVGWWLLCNHHIMLLCHTVGIFEGHVNGCRRDAEQHEYLLAVGQGFCTFTPGRLGLGCTHIAAALVRGARLIVLLRDWAPARQHLSRHTRVSERCGI